MVGFEIDFTALTQFCESAPGLVDAAIRQTMEQELARAADTAKATSAFKDRTGALRRSIGSKVEGQSLFSDGIEGTLFADTPYARFVEEGTSAHTIPARNGTMRFPIGGQWVRVREVKHPGIKARKFLLGSVSVEALTRACENAVVKAWEGQG
jgi:hypothetical protein